MSSEPPLTNPRAVVGLPDKLLARTDISHLVAVGLMMNSQAPSTWRTYVQRRADRVPRILHLLEYSPVASQ